MKYVNKVIVYYAIINIGTAYMYIGTFYIFLIINWLKLINCKIIVLFGLWMSFQKKVHYSCFDFLVTFINEMS